MIHSWRRGGTAGLRGDHARCRFEDFALSREGHIGATVRLEFDQAVLGQNVQGVPDRPAGDTEPGGERLFCDALPRPEGAAGE